MNNRGFRHVMEAGEVRLRYTTSVLLYTGFVYNFYLVHIRYKWTHLLTTEIHKQS